MQEESFSCWNKGCNEIATEQCSGCRIAKYCGESCQTADWKTGGHKQHCVALKAARVLTDAGSNENVKWSAFAEKQLDNHYDLVLKHFPSTFWAAIRGLVADDVANFLPRIRKGSHLCWLIAIFSFCHGTLTPGTNKFTGLNTDRFLRFMDEEGAWEDTLKMLLVCLQLSIDTRCQSEAIQYVTMSSLRSINDAACSKAIAERVLRCHMKTTTSRLREMWLLIRDKDKGGSDPHATMESLVYQVISILDLWSERMGIPCDEEGLKFVDRIGVLHEGNFHKSLYGMAKSFASAQIRTIDPENWS